MSRNSNPFSQINIIASRLTSKTVLAGTPLLDIATDTKLPLAEARLIIYKGKTKEYDQNTT
ncbi:MAG: hypothetical protein P1U63_10945 [Coxiellaceae bacterium]|nr:hypothetical protein [Coxiellaceae bacterium]